MEAKEKLIGRFVYRVLPLGARKASVALLKYIQIMGRNQGTAPYLNMTPEEFQEFSAMFEKTTQVVLAPDKAPFLDSIYEAHFQGHYVELVEWFSYCTEVNFGGFFQELAAKANATLQAAQGQSK